MSRQNLPPIQAWFVNREIPSGDAPQAIRKQWIDVPLPLRQLSSVESPEINIGHSIFSMKEVHILDDGMAVYNFDAVKALALFDRREAAEFWDQVVPPDYTLLFRGREGQVYPTPILQRILPGIEMFDEVEV